jgi:hypothetical protein
VQPSALTHTALIQKFQKNKKDLSPPRQKPFFRKIFNSNKAFFHETYQAKGKVRGRRFSQKKLASKRLRDVKGGVGIKPGARNELLIPHKNFEKQKRVSGLVKNLSRSRNISEPITCGQRIDGFSQLRLLPGLHAADFFLYPADMPEFALISERQYICLVFLKVLVLSAYPQIADHLPFLGLHLIDLEPLSALALTTV